MKDLITAVASLMLLLLFVLQFSGNQVLHTRMFRADMAIETFRDVVGLEGQISEENRTRLTQTLAQIWDCSGDEILVETGESAKGPAQEGSLIRYRIGYPMRNLVAAAAMLGISSEENQVWHEDAGWVVSRYYIPEEPDVQDIPEEQGKPDMPEAPTS